MRDYRKAAAKAIGLLQGWRCVRMEDLNARSTSVADWCRGVLDCDLFVGIIGHRFGTANPDNPGESYTQLEYRTAKSRGIPMLHFVTPDDFKYSGHEPDEPRKIQEAFRREVLEGRGTIKSREFTSPQGLATQIIASIYAWMFDKGIPEPVAGSRAHLLCDRTRQHQAFLQSVKDVTRPDSNVPKQPVMVYFIPGENGQCHEDLVERLAASAAESHTVRPPEKPIISESPSAAR